MGTTYKAEKCWMMIGTTDISTGTAPEFGLLYDIIVYGSEPCILFVFVVMNTLSYNSLFGAYEVDPHIEYRCLHRSSLQCYHLFNAIPCGDQEIKFIKSKYDLLVYCNYM